MRRPELVSCMLIPSPTLPKPASLSCEISRILCDSGGMTVSPSLNAVAATVKDFEADAKRPDRNSPNSVPVTVITGFLGSGKTTVLNRLLRAPDLADTAVIINEFGEVSLDHLLIEQAIENAVLLKNGCICCTVRGDILDTIENCSASGRPANCRGSAVSPSRPRARRSGAGGAHADRHRGSPATWTASW